MPTDHRPPRLENRETLRTVVPAALVDALDRVATRRGLSRSSYVRTVLTAELARTGDWTPGEAGGGDVR